MATNTDTESKNESESDDYTPPRQSDIAFLWDAVNCNPNGDPLSGDEPRRDRITGEALVSPYRIKRYLRDQMHDDHSGDRQDILVKRPDQAGQQNPLERPDAYRLIDRAIREVSETGMTASDLVEVDDDGNVEVVADAMKLSEYLQAFFETAIDVRTFGAPVSIKDGDGDDIAGVRSALPRRITGPVQIEWATSYHATDVLTEGQKITTVFSSGTGDNENGDATEKESGTFGEDHRLKYAFFGVNATIDANVASETRFSEADASYLDTALWRALKQQTLTHSKVGQEPRLYVRVEYSDGSRIGDLRRRFDVVNRDHRDDRELRSIDDLYLDAQAFLNALRHESVTDRIAAVHLTASEQLDVSTNGDDPGRHTGPDAFIDAIKNTIGTDRLNDTIEL